MTMISLSPLDLFLAGLLLLVNGAISLAFSLGLARKLFIAAARMVVQLLLLGLILAWLFAQMSLLWTALAAMVMIGFASYEVLARQEHLFTGWWRYGLGASTITIAATLVCLLALTTQIRPEPWFNPRFALPILGMILGNTMTGVSLGLNALTNAATTERAAIEARLALGHTRGEAFSGIVRKSLRTGLLPLINAMSVVGVVSLPGMMTGQILAGAAPGEAVKYQILIMFLIGGSTGFGVMLAVMGGAWRLSDHRHRLRLDRLARTG
jgi:putative ABC transport system permease protein